MLLDQYCTELDNNHFLFTRQQSSHFAKDVANDFNPLHDVDARKFCVPGDLLFARIIASEGLYSSFKVEFSGMVNSDVELSILSDDQTKYIKDLSGKEYLSFKASGEKTDNKALIKHLVCSYVAFSGENFPNVFVPLMKRHNVMINVERPLVIYESMSLNLDSVDLNQPTIEATPPVLVVNGKRRHVTLGFVFKDGGVEVGRGEKTMVLANLRPYEQSAIDSLIEQFRQRRAAHASLK